MTRSEKIAAIRNRRAVMKAAGKRLPRKKRPPRQLYPHSLEREYERALLRLTAPFFEAVQSMVKKDLARITAAHDETMRADAAGEIRMDASYASMIGEVISGIRVNVGIAITETAMADMADSFGRRVSDFNAGQVDRQFEAVLGIPVLRQEKWLADKLSGFVTGNVSLIGDITEKGTADISSLLMARVEAGDSTKTIAKAIEERLEITKRRAQFIARDQIAKLNGKLTQLRHAEVGVEKYIWRAVKDGATRFTHLRNDGKTFRWDKPPETGHPGDDFQCRCSAEPVLDEFIAMPEKLAA